MLKFLLTLLCSITTGRKQYMSNYNLNKEKSIASLLYICNELGGAWDLYSILKMLYFAEQKHLVKYGRPITGDDIVAMKFGPVPSCAYDLVKPKTIDCNHFDISEDLVVSCKDQPNMDFLSESDVLCLNESIRENRDLNFGQLKDKSHDSSYEKAWALKRNSVIPFDEIAASAGANEELRKYILLNIENERLVLK